MNETPLGAPNLPVHMGMSREGKPQPRVRPFGAHDGGTSYVYFNRFINFSSKNNGLVTYDS